MIAYLDCFSGVSGDKLLGALVGAGVSVEDLEAGLGPLGLPDWSLVAEPVERRGFAGVKVTVDVGGGPPSRTWRDIRGMIEAADLGGGVGERALVAFGMLASAEARAHGVEMDDIHFHEVGAVDSIVDVVGAAVGMEALGIERLVCSPVAVGGGTTDTAHGRLPVPAPATALLLEDVPVVGGPEDFEMTTPTGAALVRAFAHSFGPMPPMTPRATGLGAGTADPLTPNLLRLIVGDPAEGERSETIAVLRSVIDHRTPEELAHALERVLAEGALDAWQTPVVMKKGRAGIEVTVIAAPRDAEAVATALMRETGTLGVRREFAERTVAARSSVTLETTLGEVRFKVAEVDGVRHVRPEYDDAARLALEHGIPVHEVSARLTSEAEELLGA